MSISRLIRLALPVTLSVLITACAGIPQSMMPARPGLSIDSVSLTGLSFSSAELTPVVRITNPNVFSLPPLGLEGDVTIAGESIAVFRLDRAMNSVPAQGAGDLSFPVELPFNTILKAGGQIKPGTRVPYQINLDLVTELPVLGLIRIPASKEGFIPIPGPLSINVSDISLVSASFTSMVIRLDLAVKNPNSFSIDRALANLAIEQNGRSLIAGDLAVRDIQPGQTKNSSVDFKFDNLQLARSLLSGSVSGLSLTGDLRWNLDGLFDLKQALDLSL